MFLLVLDKNPVHSAYLVPKGISLKQTIELCQLISSCGISNVYKPVRQGKALMEWIKKNPKWVNYFLYALIGRISPKSFSKIIQISVDLSKYCEYKDYKVPTTAIFRYSKDYECDIPTNTELPIEQCISEYQKYIKWKQDNKVRGY